MNDGDNSASSINVLTQVAGEIALVGVGGVGCAVLRLLMHCERVKSLVLIDPDTVALSDLTRQYFFGAEDVGALKAELLATRCNAAGGKSARAIPSRVQDAMDQLRDVSVFVCCVDNLEARVVLNRHLKERGTSFVLVDTGSEKFSGHVLRVTERSACLHCCIGLYEPEGRAAASCTLRGRPRDFKDCLARAVTERPSPSTAESVHERAITLAEEAGVPVDSQRFTSNFLNDFRVNLAPVNDLIACVAIRVLLRTQTPNYASIGVLRAPSVRWMELEADPRCPVCAQSPLLEIELGKHAGLADLVAAIPETTGVDRFGLFDADGGLIFAHNLRAALPASPLPAEGEFALCQAGTGRRWRLRVRLTAQSSVKPADEH